MKLSDQLVQNIFSYLQTRPWNEVNQLIVRMSEEAKQNGNSSNPDGSGGQVNATVTSDDSIVDVA